jgi:hypothetical protein
MIPIHFLASGSLEIICSASSFFPLGIGCLPWFAPPQILSLEVVPFQGGRSLDGSSQGDTMNSCFVRTKDVAGGGSASGPGVSLWLTRQPERRRPLLAQPPSTLQSLRSGPPNSSRRCSPTRGLTATRGAARVSLTWPRAGAPRAIKVAGEGGAVGPELTTVAKCLTAEEIVESIYWPSRSVKPEYRAYALHADRRPCRSRDRQSRRRLRQSSSSMPTGQSHERRSCRYRRARRRRLAHAGERRSRRCLRPNSGATSSGIFSSLDARPGLESRSPIGRASSMCTREPLRPDDWPNRDLWVNKHRDL